MNQLLGTKRTATPPWDSFQHSVLCERCRETGRGNRQGVMVKGHSDASNRKKRRKKKKEKRTYQNHLSKIPFHTPTPPATFENTLPRPAYCP